MINLILAILITIAIIVGLALWVIYEEVAEILTFFGLLAMIVISMVGIIYTALGG